MTVVDVKTTPLPGAKLKFFLRDIEPFFQDRPFLYIDVGAYDGGVFAEIFQSPLRPKRAYLIEPNPASFARLQETVRALAAEDVAVCYNLALGAAEGRLRFRADDTMTRVADDEEAEGAGAASRFEVAARPLDALAADFLAPHLSLLKIDVEGFEAEVLAGAAGLLAEQAIDMLYIEAGLDPANPRLTYYRRIEDLLNGHGYRLFRIYEQKNEWLEDSPLLRRVNLAFMSRRFAEGHPFRLSRELFALRQKQAEIEARLAERERALGEARAGLDRLRALEAEHAGLTRAEATTRAELATARARLATARGELEAARGELAAAQGELAAAQGALAAQAGAAAAERDRQAAALKALEDRVAAMESYGRSLETKYLELLASRTWRAMEPVRRVSRLFTGKKPPARFEPRLGGQADRNGSPSPKGMSPGNARKTAESLIQLAGRRDVAALLAREAEFAGQDSDEGVFLGRFALLLALNRFAAYSEAAQVVDELDRRFARKHGWLVKTFGKTVFTRFVVDATTALTRVGRYQDARRLIDGALARLDGAPALLKQRAELAWPYDAAQAQADLAEAARRGALSEGGALLAAYLEMEAGAPPETWDGRAEPAQLPLVAAEAARRRGDFAGYRERLNGYFAAQGLAPPLPATAEGFAFEALATGAPVGRDGPLVSVVMTTFDSAATLDYALASIRGQTHGNLEILVVDDGSTDATRERLAAHAAADPRVRVLLNDANVGTYLAKNRAIAEAAGDYVTLHDSDDWAHPERIARHVRMMEENPGLVAARSDWLRLAADGALHFRRWGCKFQHANPASTFLRRAALAEAGFFDGVRYGADSEYWFRLARVFGSARVKTLPLCLGLGHTRADSLTRSGSGAMDQENYSPVRGAYNASYMRWHATAPPADLRLPAAPGRRAFWAPPEMAEGAAGPAAAPGETEMPEFVFGISLASKAASADWTRTQDLLGHTLRSLLNQSDPRFSVLICGHERPALAELDDPRVRFLECDQPPPKSSAKFRGDKMRKRRLIGAALRARGGGYFFPLDADDLVHRDVVAHVRRDDNRRGYLIERGYALDYNNRVLAPIPGAWSVSFDRTCGSSAVIFFARDELPVSGEMDEELYFNLFQSHAYWPLVAEESGRRFEPLPFAGGVYVVNHAQNLSFRLQRKGVRTENIVRAIDEHRVEDAGSILAGQFGVTG